MSSGILSGATCPVCFAPNSFSINKDKVAGCNACHLLCPKPKQKPKPSAGHSTPQTIINRDVSTVFDEAAARDVPF